MQQLWFKYNCHFRKTERRHVQLTKFQVLKCLGFPRLWKELIQTRMLLVQFLIDLIKNCTINQRAHVEEKLDESVCLSSWGKGCLKPWSCSPEILLNLLCLVDGRVAVLLCTTKETEAHVDTLLSATLCHVCSAAHSLPSLHLRHGKSSKIQMQTSAGLYFL